MNFKGVIVFFIVLVLCSGEQYVIFQVHGDEFCSDASFRSEWIFSLSPSRCTNKPFGDFVKYYETDIGNNISFVHYEDSRCNELKPGSNSTFSLGECSEVYDGYFMNVSISDSLPFDRSSSNDWYLQNNFIDNSCETPFDVIQDTMQIMCTTYLVKNDDEVLSGGLNLGSLLLCTDNWIVEEYHYSPEESDYTVDDIECWKYIPNVEPDQCISDFNETLFANSEMRSISYQCLSDAEFEANYENTVLSQTSTALYEFRYISFDSTCSLYNEIEVYKNDKCFENSFMFIQTMSPQEPGNGYIELGFTGVECNGDIVYVRIVTDRVGGEAYYENCILYGKDSVLSELNTYLHITTSNDPYLSESEGQLAKIRSYDIQCGQSLDEVKKNPGDMSVRSISYIYEGVCSESSDYNETQSLEAKCSKGVLSLNGYPDSQLCYGYYDIFSDLYSWCYINEWGYYIHYTCIPRYCNLYDEYDERVCSGGRGTCEANDICSCHDDYEGQYCETWNCGGIDYKEDDVCSGNGECVSPSHCICSGSYSGETCDEGGPASAGKIVGTVIGVFFAVTVPIICVLLCIVFVLFFICCCVGGTTGLVLLSTIIGISGITIYQNRRLAKFGVIEDIEMVISEQKAEKDTSIAHLKINKKLFEVPFEDVVIERLIGSGGSDAKVYLAEWQNQKVAMKCFRITKVCGSQVRFDQFELEVNLLASLSHPNIIRFFGASLKPPRVGIVMEYCENGEVLKFIIVQRQQKPKTGYPVSEKLRMCREIVSAINYIHQKSIIHRDLKPDNILLDRNCSCRLMDFGISKVIESTEGEKTRRIGTRSFMAPEIISGHYDESCDIYSFAILAFTLFSETPQPYGEESTKTAIEFRVANDPTYRPNLDDMKLSFGEDPNNSFSWMKEVIKKCWDGNPKNRFTAQELLGVFENESSYMRSMIGNTTEHDQPQLQEEENQELVRFLEGIIMKKTIDENDGFVLRRVIGKLKK